MYKGGGRPKVPVEEYLIDANGNESVLKRWDSVADASIDMGLDHRTVRNRIINGSVFITSLGEIRYRRSLGVKAWELEN